MRLDRVSRLGDMLGQSGSAAIISPSPDLYYLAGLNLIADERLTAGLFWPDGDAEMLVPALYADEIERRMPRVKRVVWADGDDPYGLAAARLRDRGIDSVLVDSRMRAEHLLGLQSAMSEGRWGIASALLGELRRVKDRGEIEGLRKSARLAEAALYRTLPQIRPGTTENDIAWLVEREVRSLGGEGLAFPPLVASGSNSAFPHHRAGERAIRDGDVLVLDFGCVVDGYCSDITRTVVLGRASPLIREVFNIVRRAQQEAMKAVAPGVACQDIDRAARRVIEHGGYGGRFIHRTGHGIGLDYHEEPYIVEGNAQTLVPGMTFSIEPGVYLPGRFGVRVEDVVLVTESGADHLGTAPADLIELGSQG